jgi:hypothetical protein
VELCFGFVPLDRMGSYSCHPCLSNPIKSQSGEWLRTPESYLISYYLEHINGGPWGLGEMVKSLKATGDGGTSLSAVRALTVFWPIVIRSRDCISGCSMGSCVVKSNSLREDIEVAPSVE